MQDAPTAKKPDDPWNSNDPALAIALAQQAWFARQRDRARHGYWAVEVLLLLGGASTTLAAALGATPWLTASMAASTVVLTGLRKIFDWHANWVSFAGSWAEVRATINAYRLIPVAERDRAAQRDLLRDIDRIVANDTSGWAARRVEKMRSAGDAG